MTQLDATDWIDISVTVRHGMPHWPSRGRYEMICLPGMLHGSDGAPARVILKPLGRPASSAGTSP